MLGDTLGCHDWSGGGGCWHPEGGGHGHSQLPTAYTGCPLPFLHTHTPKDDLAQTVGCAQSGKIRYRSLNRLNSHQAVLLGADQALSH